MSSGFGRCSSKDAEGLRKLHCRWVFLSIPVNRLSLAKGRGAWKRNGILPPTNLAPDRGSIEELDFFAGALPQMLC